MVNNQRMANEQSPILRFRNRQRTLSLDLPLLRRIISALLKDVLAVKEFALGISLVGEDEMTSLNERFLHHAGATDVISFNYYSGRRANVIQGDIVLCAGEAVRQARQFRTCWQLELVRYIVHGVLHLQGYDDLRPVPRRKMKREENRLVRELARRFSLKRLSARKRTPTLPQ